MLTQYIVGGRRANNLTGLQAGIYVHTFDTPGISENVHINRGLNLTLYSNYRYV
jgi:hypothetical protein